MKVEYRYDAKAIDMSRLYTTREHTQHGKLFQYKFSVEIW